MPNNNKAFQDIKGKSSLLDFVQKKTGVQPVRVGKAYRFKPCPLCESKDSFTINNKTPELYNCFVCGGGDIFTFSEKVGNLSKAEALADVAKFAGVNLDDYRDDKKPVRINKLQELLRETVKYYQACLANNHEAVQFLTKEKPAGRGHTEDTIKQMEIGFTDGGLARALKNAGYTDSLIKQSGLYVEDKNTKGKWRDYFVKGLLIFPHRLQNGDIGHFTIKDPNKRLNYQLAAEHRLKGFYFSNQKAISRDEIIIVEGENDLASCLDIDLVNTMACIGSLSDVQIRWIEKHASNKTFYFWFDNDTKWKKNKPPAGVIYTRKLYQALIKNPDCTVYVLSALMDSAEDPDDFIQKDKSTARQRFEVLKRKAQHPLAWEFSAMRPEDRENMDAALKYLQDINFFNNLGLVPNVNRSAIIKAAESVGFTREEILSAVKEFRALREMLDDLRGSTDSGYQKTERFQREFSDHVWKHFNEYGKFFVSPGDKLHLFYQHVIYSIGENISWHALLHQEAGLNATTPLSKFVTSEIKSLCHIRGDRLESFSWIHRLGSQQLSELYYNLADSKNRIIKVKAGNITLIDNGTNEDRVLLSESNSVNQFDYNDSADINNAMGYLDKYVLKSQTCPPAQAYYVVAHALSCFLLPFSKSKPLLKMEGGSQSAKTSSARVCGYLIYGRDMVGSMTTASAYSMAGQDPLLIFDNIENQDIDKNFLNFLLLLATGATRFKRTSGSDTGVTPEVLNSMAIITGIEPFSKPELINRAFTINYDRNQWGDITYNEDVVAEKIIGHRNEMLSAWLMILSREILPCMEDTAEILRYIRTSHKDHSKSRMDGHLSILTLITRSLLRYIPLSPALADKAAGRPGEYFLLDEWITYQNKQARETERSTNVILQLLDGIRSVYLQAFQSLPAVSENGDPQRIDQTVNPGLLKTDVSRQRIENDGIENDDVEYFFDVSTKELLAMFQRYAKEQGIKVPFASAGQLGVRMKNDKQVLQEAGWSFEKVKKIKGERITRHKWQG